MAFVHPINLHELDRVATDATLDAALLRLDAIDPRAFKGAHQKEGVRFMLKCELGKTCRGGILADDPGVGKTFQASLGP